MISKVISVIELDVIVKRLSCFRGFKGLINARGGYRPTIRKDYYGSRAQVLIDAYNKSQS